MIIRKDIRKHFFNKQNGKCFYCGQNLDEYFHLDHKLPKSRGGKFIKENLVASCDFCNMSKSNSTLEEYRERVKKRVINGFSYDTDSTKCQRYLYLLNSVSEDDQIKIINAYLNLINTIENIDVIFCGEDHE